jgi:hypothetical protein
MSRQTQHQRLKKCHTNDTGHVLFRDYTALSTTMKQVWHVTSLKAFVVTDLNKMFSGRQTRQGVKGLQRFRD